LLRLVLVNAEIVLGEAFDKFAAVVDDGGVENDKVDVDLNFAAGRRDAPLLAGRWRRRDVDRDLGKRNGRREQENA